MGMFVFRSGLSFSFRALEVPEPRVRKRPLSLTNMAFSSPLLQALPAGNMASETTFDHQKVVFSGGKVRKRALTQNPLVGGF